MPDLECIQADAEFKFADADAAARGEFVGYASVFGNVDLGGDVVERGAFAGTLAKRKAGDVLMLWGHDLRSVPIGKWLDLREDDRGLVARGQLTLDIPRARDVHAAMKEGTVKGLSIGYMVPKDGAEFDRSGRVRRIKAVDLIEISVVNLPMNPRAQIARVKAAEMTEREIERLLTRDAGFSRSEARALMRGGLPALKATRDAGTGADDTAAALRRLLATLSP